jgi:hypothetical protein
MLMNFELAQSIMLRFPTTLSKRLDPAKLKLTFTKVHPSSYIASPQPLDFPVFDAALRNALDMQSSYRVSLSSLPLSSPSSQPTSSISRCSSLT